MIANMTITNSPRAVKKQGYGITPYDGTGEVFGIVIQDLQTGEDGQVYISGRVKIGGLKENEYYYADDIGLLKTEGKVKIGFYSGGYLNLLQENINERLVGFNKLTVGENPPPSPQKGDIWIKTNF